MNNLTFICKMNKLTLNSQVNTNSFIIILLKQPLFEIYVQNSITNQIQLESNIKVFAIAKSRN